MTPADRSRWKLADTDAAGLASFEHLARGLGWDRRLFERAIDGLAALPADVCADPQQLAPHVVAFFEGHGRSLREFESISQWLSGAVVGDIPAAPTPSAQQDAAKLAEIRAARRADPDGFDAKGWAERDEFEILQRRGTDAPVAQVVSSQQGNASRRLAEIRELRRNDPDGYDNNRQIRAEELQLLTASMSPAGGDERTAASETLGAAVPF